MITKENTMKALQSYAPSFRAYLRGVMAGRVSVADNCIWIDPDSLPKQIAGSFFDRLIEGGHGYWALDGYTVMPRSPWTDKDGTPIYSGDIIQTVFEDDMEPSGQAVIHNPVVYKDGGFYWGGEATGDWHLMDEYDAKNGRVVGNVFENGELLDGHQPELSNVNPETCDLS